MTQKDAIEKLYKQLNHLATTVYSRGLIHHEETIMEETLALLEGVKASGLLEAYPKKQSYKFVVEDVSVKSHLWRGAVELEKDNALSTYQVYGDIETRKVNGEWIATVGSVFCSNPKISIATIDTDKLNEEIDKLFDYNYEIEGYEHKSLNDPGI